MPEEEKPEPNKEKELTPLEACEKLSEALVVFQDSALILDEVCSTVRSILKTLCPGTPDYSRVEFSERKPKKDSKMDSPWDLKHNGLK